MSVQLGTDFSNKKYLCQSHSDNDNEYSPEVSWTPIEGVQSYALIFEDPDALPRPRNFIHWYIPYISPEITQINKINITRNQKVVDNISKNISKLALTNNNKVKIIMGKNSMGNIGYHGPCAPENTGKHRYILKLYGLKQNIPLDIKNLNLSIESSTDFEKRFKKYIINSNPYQKTYYYEFNEELSNS